MKLLEIACSRSHGEPRSRSDGRQKLKKANESLATKPESSDLDFLLEMNQFTAKETRCASEIHKKNRDEMGFISQTLSNIIKLVSSICVKVSGTGQQAITFMRPQMKCSSWRPPAIVGTVSPQPPATGCVNWRNVLNVGPHKHSSWKRQDWKKIKRIALR